MPSDPCGKPINRTRKPYAVGSLISTPAPPHSLAFDRLFPRATPRHRVGAPSGALSHLAQFSSPRHHAGPPATTWPISGRHVPRLGSVTTFCFCGTYPRQGDSQTFRVTAGKRSPGGRMQNTRPPGRPRQLPTAQQAQRGARHGAQFDYYGEGRGTVISPDRVAMTEQPNWLPTTVAAPDMRFNARTIGQGARIAGRFTRQSMAISPARRRRGVKV